MEDVISGTVTVKVLVSFLRNETLDERYDKDSDLIFIEVDAFAFLEVERNYGADADGNRGEDISFYDEIRVSNNGEDQIANELDVFEEETGFHILSYDVEIDSDTFNPY